MDTFALMADERRRLADELDHLADGDWTTPSRCAGWTAHTVAAHLNLPWELSSPRFLLEVVKQRGSIDRTMDVQSRKLAERLDPASCVAGLRANATDRFVPPTMPPEAPLSDVVLHGADILRPLGRSVAVDDEALRRVLGFVTSPKAQRGFGTPPLTGLRFEATDIDWSAGDAAGALVRGPALAVAGAIVGRTDHRTEVEGDGVVRLLPT